MDKFSQIQKRLLNNLPNKIRPIYLKIEFNSRGNLLYGPRGVGKTTLMLYKINAEEDSFFFSADNPLIADTQLYDFVDFIIMQGYKKIYIDEKYSGSHIDFKPGYYALLGVTDNGCGIDKDKIYDSCDQLPFRENWN